MTGRGVVHFIAAPPPEDHSTNRDHSPCGLRQGFRSGGIRKLQICLRPEWARQAVARFFPRICDVGGIREEEHPSAGGKGRGVCKSYWDCGKSDARRRRRLEFAGFIRPPPHTTPPAQFPSGFKGKKSPNLGGRKKWAGGRRGGNHLDEHSKLFAPRRRRTGPVAGWAGARGRSEIEEGHKRLGENGGLVGLP